MSVNAWLSELSAHGRSESSIKIYKSMLSIAKKTLDEIGVGMSAAKIDTEIIHRMIPMIEAKEDSKRQILRTLGSWVEWETGRNPFKDAKVLWNKADKKRTFIDESILDAALRESAPRERLIILLGAKMGLRCVEISRITMSDLSDERLLIRGKGHQEGKIVSAIIPPSVKKAIEEWIPIRAGFANGSSNALILTIKGTGISPGSIQEIFCDLSERIGVKITPHSLRRLFAMTLYRKHDVDLLDVSRLMRHESISTTQLYIREDREMLDKIAFSI